MEEQNEEEIDKLEEMELKEALLASKREQMQRTIRIDLESDSSAQPSLAVPPPRKRPRAQEEKEPKRYAYVNNPQQQEHYS